MLEPAAESQPDRPSAGRLVIRIKFIPKEPPQPPAWRRLSGSVLLIVGAVAALLSWLGVGTFFRSEPTSPPAAVATIPAPTPAPLEVRPEPDAPTAAINEVIPNVPQSALKTIRGTIRVSIRVVVDKQGAVIDAATDERGPSRYFERLALDASRKWMFTPVHSEQQRIVLVKFNFTRAGAIAHASPLQQDHRSSNR